MANFKIDTEAFFSTMLQEMGAYQEYAHESARYRARHGHAAFITSDTPIHSEKGHLKALGDIWRAKQDATYMFSKVFKMTDTQYDDMKCGARALRKWYERTDWERCISQDDGERMLAWIFREED